METISERFDTNLGVSTYPVPISSRALNAIVHHTLKKSINKDKCTADPNLVGHNSRKKAFPFTHFLAPVYFYIFFFFQVFIVLFINYQYPRHLIGQFNFFYFSLLLCCFCNLFFHIFCFQIF